VTERVEVDVTASVPPETNNSPEVKLGVKRDPLTLKLESKVEDALMNSPAALEVGVKAFVNKVSHAPGSPDDPPEASSPAQKTLPDESVVNVPPPAKLEQSRLLIVKPLVNVTAPLNLEVPRTPNVVEAFTPPIMTSFSFALTTKVFVSKTPESEKVEVAWVIDSSWVPPAAMSTVF
jgi:hypothetical protein